MTGYLITHCHVFCINFVNEFALVKDKPVQSPSLSQSESKNPEHVVSIWSRHKGALLQKITLAFTVFFLFLDIKGFVNLNYYRNTDSSVLENCCAESWTI